jgi:hypothetical protein
MTGVRARVWRSTVAAQAALATVVLLVLAFAPPVYGRLMLIPLDGKRVSRALLDRWTLTPIAYGPLPGSVVADGKGRELAPTLFHQGIVVLAAPAALCHGTIEARSSG